MFTKECLESLNSNGVVFNLENFISCFYFYNQKLVFFSKEKLPNVYQIDIKYFLDIKKDVFLRLRDNCYVKINSFENCERRYVCNRAFIKK